MTEIPRAVMRELPLADRPYEKMELSGPRALSETELLAIILVSGSGKATSLDVARSLLGDGRSLRELAEMSLEELKGFHGIGRSKALRIRAALELASRLHSGLGKEIHPRINGPEDVIRLMEGELARLPREEFHILLLDVRGRLIRKLRISGGGSVNTSIFPKDVFREAVRANAHAMILCHNHPSGDSQPSPSDIESSERLRELGERIGIQVLDHIVIGSRGSLSLKEAGFI